MNFKLISFYEYQLQKVSEIMEALAKTINDELNRDDDDIITFAKVIDNELKVITKFDRIVTDNRKWYYVYEIDLSMQPP